MSAPPERPDSGADSGAGQPPGGAPRSTHSTHTSRAAQSSQSAPGGITFTGDFTPAECDYLATQFSRCRVELLGRAPRNAAQAVIAWHATGETFNRRGPGPLLGASMPRRAVYVLHVDAAMPGGGRLVPVRTQQALLDEIGEAPPGVDVGPPPGSVTSAWEGAKRALRGLVPWQPGR
jgi:hypothetical protein